MKSTSANLPKRRRPWRRPRISSEKIQDDFGALEDWRRAFKGVGEMRGRGLGAARLRRRRAQTFQHLDQRTQRQLAAATSPILLMDVWEHAFMLDYGLKRQGIHRGFFRKAIGTSPTPGASTGGTRGPRWPAQDAKKYEFFSRPLSQRGD